MNRKVSTDEPDPVGLSLLLSIVALLVSLFALIRTQIGSRRRSKGTSGRANRSGECRRLGVARGMVTPTRPASHTCHTFAYEVGTNRRERNYILRATKVGSELISVTFDPEVVLEDAQ